MKKTLLVLLVFLFNFSFLFSYDFSNYSKVKFKIYENITYDFPTNQNREIDTLKLTPKFLVLEGSNQKITNINSNFDFIRGEENLVFEIENIKQSDIIQIEYTLEKFQNFVEIKNKENFPYVSDYKKDLGFNEFINLDSNIREISSNIAQGKDDTFEVAFDIAKWIEYNVNYNLSSILENPNRKATEVLQDKTGVCREIVILFASMMRSLNIPTRIVSGVSYTNNEELVSFIGNNFGGHVWAEVLINDKWVPFDLTYKQYGFVDSSHIEFKKGDDFNYLNPISVAATGFIDELDISVERNYKIEPIDFTQKNFLNSIDFKTYFTQNISTESFGYINIELLNKEDFYYPLLVELSFPDDIIIDEKVYPHLLKPNEKKELDVNFKIELDNTYIYKIPFSIYFNSKKIFNSTINSRDKFDTFEKVENTQNEKSEVLITQLSFLCDYVFSNSKNINCAIKNQGNTILKDINICLKDKCKTETLFLFQQKELSFKNDKDENISNVLIKYKDSEKVYNLIKKEEPKVNLNIIRKTNEVIKIEYDIENFDEKYTLEFLMDNSTKKSFIQKTNFFLFETQKESIPMKYKLFYEGEIISQDSFLLQNEFDVFFEIELFFKGIIELFF